MQGIWANFAKDPYAGPAPPAVWPPVASSPSDLYVFGANGSVAVPSGMVDGPCAVIDETLVGAGLG